MYLRQTEPVRESIIRRCLEEEGVTLNMDYPQTNFCYNF